MKALLIVAHGSRRKDSNDEIRRLARQVDGSASAAFDRVAGAFLEIASPRVGTAIADLAEKGVTEIRVLPYFLAAGSHVAVDLPRQVGEAKEAFPDIHFEILPHLGAHPGLRTLLFNL